MLPPNRPPGARVIVLGIDGMDPAFLERHWRELPNLDRLRREGDFQRLATTLKVDVFVDPTELVARFDLEGRSVILKPGELSEWIPVSFPLLPALASAEGMIRIQVKELRPHFAVYVSPVNIDPSAPAMPISEPESYSRDLAREIGPFYTQGMPYDTAAFRYGVFTREEYHAHSREVSRQALALPMG